MALSKESIDDFKQIYEKQTGKTLTDEEAFESANNLLNFFKILIEIETKERQRAERLKDEPKGFDLRDEDGIYNCRVCYTQVSGTEAWWDLNGVKCLDCQRNIEEGVIPGEICKDDKIWFKDWELKEYLGLHSSTVKKLRKEGKLKGRELKDKQGRVYFVVYMIEENIEFIKENYDKSK